MVERVGLYMANLRPKIVKLAKMVGGVAGAMNRIDEKAPEYYALNAVVTDDMADVALVMGFVSRVPLSILWRNAAEAGKRQKSFWTSLHTQAW